MDPKRIREPIGIEDLTTQNNRPFGRYFIEVEGKPNLSIVTEATSYSNAHKRARRKTQYGEVKLSLYEKDEESPALD